MGGAGKTALVERYLAGAGLGVFTHSFYDDARTEGVVEELCRVLDAPEDGVGGRLVVLDGLETVQSEGGNGRSFGEVEDPALRRVLRAACTGVGAGEWRRTKVLVTSRFPLTDLAGWEGAGLRTLQLGPLSPAESTVLLRAWGLQGDERALAPVVERAGGHALSVAMLGSYVGAFLGGDASQLAAADTSTAPRDDREARRLAAVLDSYASALAPSERDLLARLSLFAGAADVTLLATIASESTPDEAAVVRSLARLERLGLVARTRSEAGTRRVSAHPFVREHFKALLGVPVEAVHGRVRDAIVASLEGKPATHVRDPELLDRYEALLAHTLRAGRPDEAWGIYQRALGGFENLGLRLGAMSRGARVLDTLADTGAPERARRDLGRDTWASLLYDRGLYAGALGDLAFARRCHDAHLDALEGMDPDVAGPRRAMALRTLAYVAWQEGQLDVARAQLDASIQIARAIESSFHRVRGFALLAIVEHDAGDAEAATRWLAQARSIEPVSTARRAFWEAEILLARGELYAARALCDRATRECARRGWGGHIAHGMTVLGLAWVDEDPARAADHLAAARPWVHEAGEVETALRCHHLAVRVAVAKGRREEAAREAALGQALARAHGFGLFDQLFAALSANRVS